MAAELVKMTDPGLLDSTGQKILEEMRIQNAYLALLAQDKITTLDSTWDKVAALVRAGHGKAVYGIGDKFIDVWKDTAAEKEYNFPWRVNHFDNVDLQDGETIPAMFIQAHFTSPFGVQFSQAQAFYYAENGLPAGTYHLTNADYTWGENCKPGSYSFTLAQDVPVGGKLAGFRGMPDAKMDTWKVYSYAADSKTIIETVPVISGALGTKLGDWTRYYDGTSNLNGIQRTAYGHNRWATSALRQYLNSNKGVGAWWSPQSKFDIAPNELTTKAGFLSGLPDSLKNILKAVKVVTYCNTVDGDDKTQVQDVTYDKVFLPSLEQMYVKPQMAGEGNAHEYWKRIAGTSEPLAQYGTYPSYIHYGADNNSSPVYVRLRSAFRGYSCSSWFVHASGGVYDGFASGAGRFAPLVAIC